MQKGHFCTATLWNVEVWSDVENDDLGDLKSRLAEIIVDSRDNLIDDLQKRDCYGLNGERKPIPTSSPGSLAHDLLHLGAF